MARSSLGGQCVADVANLILESWRATMISCTSSSDRCTPDLVTECPTLMYNYKSPTWLAPPLCSVNFVYSAPQPETPYRCPLGGYFTAGILGNTSPSLDYINNRSQCPTLYAKQRGWKEAAHSTGCFTVPLNQLYPHSARSDQRSLSRCN